MPHETVTARTSRLAIVFAGAALVYAYFAVASIVGAGTSVGVGLVATIVATALYVSSALVWLALVVVAVSSARRSRRTVDLDPASMRFIAFAPPLAGALLLAAAYVARMNGQPFLGGFEAMIVTTVALVVLSRAFPSLGLGVQPATATSASTSTEPSAGAAEAGVDQRQSSGGGGASS